MSRYERAMPFHPTNAYVEWREKNKAVFVGGVATRGLTTGLLAKTFYPDYSFVGAVIEATESSSSSRPLPRRVPTWVPRRRSVAALKSAGRKRGTQLDKQLSHVLAFRREYQLDKRLFGCLPPSAMAVLMGVDRSTSKRRLKFTLKECEKVIQESPKKPVNYNVIDSKAASKRLQSLVNSASPHTRLLWDELDSLNLQLIAVQVACGVSGLAATCLDGIAMNSRNQFVVLEFKTGGESYLMKHTGMPMRSPFHDQTDCALHQYFLQLGIGAMLYSQTFPAHDALMGTPLLMQVTQRECRSRELPDWVSVRLDQAVLQMYQH